MKRILITIAFSVIAAASAFATEGAENASKNHFKLYGFIRNYFIYDSRESVSGTGDLFYYLPKDVKMNEAGTQDMNAAPSFRFLALTSRLGMDVSGYKVGNAHLGAKFEGDFYNGLSSLSDSKVNGLSGNTSVSGAATGRLRQAYLTITWKDIPLSQEQKAIVGLKVGQAWHPMAADMPHVFSLEAGAPFGPFSRTPQATMDASFGKNWMVSASALWQMQYRSNGPSGSSAEYMKYGCTPEIYLGLTYKNKGFLARAGVDLLSIKPRNVGETIVTVPDPASSVTPGATKEIASSVFVSDRKTSLLYYMYAQYSHKNFAIKAKTTYGESGEHLNLMSGYAKVRKNEDGSWEYASLRSSSSWMSMSYGKKWQGVLFLGYIKNFGLAEPLSKGYLNTSDLYYCTNGFNNLNQMYRINPQLIYNIGKLNVGLEYQLTSVQYGDLITVTETSDMVSTSFDVLDARGLAPENLRWVSNHRINLMVKYNF